MENQELIKQIKETVEKFNQLTAEAQFKGLTINSSFSGINNQGNLQVRFYQELK